MRGFYASCGALVVGILLVGTVHAGPRPSSKRHGQHSRHYSGHHRRALRPWLLQLPWQWLPEQSQGSVDYDTGSGGYDTSSGADDPNAGGPDPNSGDSQTGGDIGGGSVAPPAVPLRGGSQRRLPRFSTGSPRMSRPGSVRR
jgi:hypothetical protein